MTVDTTVLVPRGNRRMALAISTAALLVVTGCAAPRAPVVRSAETQTWTGRLSLRVDSEPVQSFAAMFELTGAPEAGELTLTSPIGSTLAVLQWSPDQALLRNGNDTRRYASLDALIQAATGAAIPVPALFGWLAGREDTVPGWRPNLSQVAQGRLQATRESPQPEAELRIVFERP